ncbi:hypothetical protein I8751_14685 [Nostocaceae cyanobacterium CENA357]|uniref:Uncharacterized protein n=1 Tax=Atlanticothrix silvestris CENA357 TaxID=1725252 RepID=A0A8J7HIN4_9CYAN|nr:hypothetical protein [Atlanticothrix silvestris]MBH8553594.1 hypothetical protein [Atlanticothrix silvestris CENA357]
MKLNVFRRNKNQTANAKRQLFEALRRRDGNAIKTLMTRWQKILGEEKLTEVIINEVIVECDSDSHCWFVQHFLGQSKYQQLQQQAQNNVFHILVNAGLEPGKDFSLGLNSEMIMSDRAQQILLNQLPQEHRALFEAQVQTSLVPDPMMAIEKQLGCAFFTNLIKIASQKVQSLTNSQAAAYLGVVLAGLVKRHPALQDMDFPTKFIFQSLQELSQERATAILNDEQTNPQFDEIIIFQDLLAAMGEPDFHRIAQEESTISLKQFKELDLVWCGERRISEIVAVMEG